MEKRNVTRWKKRSKTDMCGFLGVSNSDLPRKQKWEQVDSKRTGNKCDGARGEGLQAFVIWYNHFRGEEIMNYGYNLKKEKIIAWA